MKYAAVIETCSSSVGFDWGDPDLRPHHLFAGETWGEVLQALYAGQRVVPRWLELVMETRDEDVTREMVEETIGRIYGDHADVACGDGDPLPSDLPSMGSPEWGSDDWLGAADYASYAEWCRILAVDDDYILPDEEDIAADVREYLRHMSVI